MDHSLAVKCVIESNRIPTLPNQVRHLLQAFNNENLSLREMARIIEDHPSIAARLIALANSAWLAPVVPVTSIERACANLGLTIVRSVSIGLALISPFRVGFCPAFDLRRFWVSSQLVADAALSLATKLPDSSSYDFLQTAHTGGLLHNFGLLCLADIMPRETHQALIQAQNDPEISLNAALSELLGTDFREMGAWLVETWGLPQGLIALMKHYANPDYRDMYWQEARLVGYAVELVDLVYRQESLPKTLVFKELSLTSIDFADVFDQLKFALPEVTENSKTLF
jgi:HD-like signal output (HDOD) protein